MDTGKDLPIARVTWRDAWVTSGPSAPGSWGVSCEVVTVGFLIEDENSPDHLHIVAEIGSSGEGEDPYRSITHVPAGMVTSVVYLVADPQHGPLRAAYSDIWGNSEDLEVEGTPS